MTSIYKKICLSIGLGALVFLAFSVYLAVDPLARAFHGFDWWAVAAALLLALVNYGIRFWRWDYYLDLLSIQMERSESLRVFLSGLVLSVKPGKAGELMKAVLVRQAVGTPVGVTSAAVFAERLTDFVALTLLSLVGILSFRQGVLTLTVALVGSFALLLLVFWPGALRWSLELVGRLPGIGRLAIPLSPAYEGARRLLSTRAFIRGLCLALVAWFAECLAFQIVLLGFDQDIGTVASTFIYAFATIFGALTFIPGGLGTTEGSMAALLGVHGVGLELAVAATFVIRVCTLWFAVLIGGVVLLRSGFTTTAGDASESTPTT